MVDRLRLVGAAFLESQRSEEGCWCHDALEGFLGDPICHDKPSKVREIFKGLPRSPRLIGVDTKRTAWSRAGAFEFDGFLYYQLFDLRRVPEECGREREERNLPCGYPVAAPRCNTFQVHTGV